MKKIVVLFAALALVFVSCKTTTPTEEVVPPEPKTVEAEPTPEPKTVEVEPTTPEQKAEGDLGEIQGRFWKLSEVRLIDDTITLRKKGKPDDLYGEYYTAFISGSEIKGTAAPSTFSVSYTGDSIESLDFDVLKIEVAPSSITLPGLPFTEDDCLLYIEKGIERIQVIKNESLTLFTRDEDDKEVALVFISEN
ncbi:MAG: hypothetical protein LBB43_03210 [Spirochaetaceae bacterium]|jgi:hypothetical protein|nr:hypothetical protein [Spirochaetaceae bacterium]